MSSDIHLELEDDSFPVAVSTSMTPPSPVDISHSLSTVLSYHPLQALNIAIVDWISQVLNITCVLEIPQTIITPESCAPPHEDTIFPVDKTPFVNNVPLPGPIETDSNTLAVLSVSPANDSQESNAELLEAMDTTITPSTSPSNQTYCTTSLDEARKLLLENNQRSDIPKTLVAIQDLEMKSRVNSSATLVDMRTACSSPSVDLSDCDNKNSDNRLSITVDDVKLLVDLYYQPFEHGSTGRHILDESQWLIFHRHCMKKQTLQKDKSVRIYQDFFSSVCSVIMHITYNYWFIFFNSR